MVNQPVFGIDLDSAVVASLFGPAAPFSPDALARLLDESGIDVVVLGGDTLHPEHPASTEFDASVAAAVLAAASENVGFVIAANPALHHPYNLARRLASLDHLTHGRVGWLVGARPATKELEPDYTLPADAVEVARKLWESFPAESVVADTDRGVFVESEHITFIDHDGVFAVSGPLNVPEPPQGKPPIFWQAHSDVEFAAARRVADVVVARSQHVPIDEATPILDAVEWSGSWPNTAPNRFVGTIVRIRGVAELENAIARAEGNRRSDRATLRNRLGLPPSLPAFHGPRRSLFPVS
ncbi:LLM class flavin-dependent oxidoreductase [Aldersonia kunmingensis]|uniref:LLM class flavin-dependent oxidoreductase n=1 Tax=Aldersonia kunmingensis TaxID=408066 RepID=UPI00082A8054|nr:LLM class flavin-dependent oxidoreductase [Aldersonia kunmingensis]